MNELRFEIGSPYIKLDRYGKRECLTFKDDYGKNEITFEMDKDLVVDIVLDIICLLTPEQIKQLDEKMRCESSDEENIDNKRILRIKPRGADEFQNYEDFRLQRYK